MALIINGTAGNDNLAGGEYSADIIDGLAGNDTLWGYSGDDLLLGNMGDDLLGAGDGNDIGLGGSGADTIWMGAGNDLADGGSGSDLIGGGSGNDLLWGDNGFTAADAQAIAWTLDQFDNQDDLGSLLNVGMTQLLNATGNYARDWQSHDTIWAGTGSDIAFGGLGNDVIGGGTGNDALSGGRGNDTIYGAAGNDIVYGNDEHDLLFGGAGNDTIADGGGQDTIWGGAGDDLMLAGNWERQEGNVDTNEDGVVDVYDRDFDRCLDNDTDTFGFEGCHGQDTILAFDARKGYQNAEDLIDLTAYNYGSMDDVNLVNYTVDEYNALDIDGNGILDDDDLDSTVADQVDGVALIQNPSCCNCYGVSENSITIAYIGDFDSSNILL